MIVEVDATQFNASTETIFGEFEKATLEEFEVSATEMQDEMRVAGDPITYPVKWDSPKQRRFVMWKLSKEGRLPYRRTNNYINAWTLVKEADGIGLVNKHPAGAIGGTLEGNPPTTWQSKIHRNRWPSLLKSLLRQLDTLVERIIENAKARLG